MAIGASAFDRIGVGATAFGATGIFIGAATLGGLTAGLAIGAARRDGAAAETRNDNCFISACNAFNACSTSKVPEALYVLPGSAFARSRATTNSASACTMRAAK